MSSIGEFEFLKMEGPPIPLLAVSVDIIDRAGVDGTASSIDALKAEEVTEYTTEGVANLTTANSRADDYPALKGTHVTVINDIGREVEDVLVVDVRILNTPQKLARSVPAGTSYLVRAVWLLKPTKA
ncbi:MAG: hypothetical protein PHY02_06310 [Phycisphaerae bacterium]|nr:hypothetical protein [Phycisphaerae bacterium]